MWSMPRTQMFVFMMKMYISSECLPASRRGFSCATQHGAPHDRMAFTRLTSANSMNSVKDQLYISVFNHQSQRPLQSYFWEYWFDRSNSTTIQSLLHRLKYPQWTEAWTPQVFQLSLMPVRQQHLDTELAYGSRKPDTSLAPPRNSVTSGELQHISWQCLVKLNEKYLKQERGGACQ